MKIRDFAQVVNGSTPNSKNIKYYNGDIVWFTPKDLSEQNSKYVSTSSRKITEEGYKSCSTNMLPKGSILLTSRAPIGLVAITTVPCCTNQGFKSLIVDTEKCNSEYLYYYLKLHIRDIESLGSGTTFKEISKSSIENYEIDLPSIEKQEKIVSILVQLDSIIQNNKKQIQILEKLAQTIYDYWFVQFDFPNEEGKPYKSNKGKMVWNDILKWSIPENWQAVPLNNWLNIKSGFPFDSDTYKKLGKYKIITIKNVQDGVLVTTGCDYVDEIPPKAKDYVSLKIGDRLISLTGNCGRLCVVSETNLLLNQRVGLLDCSEEMLEYTYQLLKSPYMKKKAEYLANGAAQANLSPIDLCNIYTILPPKDVIYAFNDIVANIRSKIIKCTQEITNLTSLREDLLPLLINGQVTINS